MQLYESRLNHFNDKARINYCKSRSVHQHGGPSRPRQNCHSCIFETKENSNLRICIQYLGHHSKTTCRKSAESMRYRVRPKFEFYRKSLLMLTLPNIVLYLFLISTLWALLRFTIMSIRACSSVPEISKRKETKF